VAVRLAGVALLVAMPFMPAYRWAAAIYVVRSMMNRGSAGARQAFGVGLVRDRRRGLASSVNGLSFRLPSAIGPAVSGWLMAAGSLDLPFYLSAGLQLAYVVLFGTVLGPYDRPGGGAGEGRRSAAAG
jgi:predicted MFS family arabinose efflux permease